MSSHTNRNAVKIKVIGVQLASLLLFSWLSFPQTPATPLKPTIVGPLMEGSRTVKAQVHKDGKYDLQIEKTPDACQPNAANKSDCVIFGSIAAADAQNKGSLTIQLP